MAQKTYFVSDKIIITGELCFTSKLHSWKMFQNPYFPPFTHMNLFAETGSVIVYFMTH